MVGTLPQEGWLKCIFTFFETSSNFCSSTKWLISFYKHGKQRLATLHHVTSRFRTISLKRLSIEGNSRGLVNSVSYDKLGKLLGNQTAFKVDAGFDQPKIMIKYSWIKRQKVVVISNAKISARLNSVQLNRNQFL